MELLTSACVHFHLFYNLVGHNLQKYWHQKLRSANDLRVLKTKTENNRHIFLFFFHSMFKRDNYPALFLL